MKITFQKFFEIGHKTRLSFSQKTIREIFFKFRVLGFILMTDYVREIQITNYNEIIQLWRQNRSTIRNPCPEK